MILPADHFEFKGTVSRDWGGLLMDKMDKTHLFNVAGDGLFSILITFPY